MKTITWRARVVSSPPQSVAAIDLGTNACRLLIANPNADGTLNIIDSYSESVCLGENLKHSGVLSESAQIRTIQSLERIQEKLEKYNLLDMRAVATEACRQAKNTKDFFERVRQKTNITLEVISPTEEARLAVLSCVGLLSDSPAHSLIFDIGGGSTQIALLHNKDIVDTISIPYGVITLSDYIQADSLTPSTFDTHVALIESYIQPFLQKFPYINTLQVLGTSGTITTVAATHLNMTHYNRRRIDGTHICMDIIETLTRHIACISPTERIRNPCIGADRASLMPAGCVILYALNKAMQEQGGNNTILIADRGIREGILLNLIHRKGA